MRRGIYFFDNKIYGEQHVVRFVGFQIAGSTVNSIIVNVFIQDF